MRSHGFVAAAVVLLLEASYFKPSRIFNWLPWDLTVLTGALVAGILAVSVIRFGLTLVQGLGWTLALFTLFAQGWLFAGDGGNYGASKVTSLFTVTLLCALAPLFLIRTEERRSAFVCGVAVAGIAFGLLVLFVDPNLSANHQRLALEGGNEIAAGRAAGAGLLVLLILTMRRRLHWVLGVSASAFLAVVLFESGSRGPLVAAAAALIVGVVVAPGLHARRFGRLLVGAGALVIFTWVGLQVAPEASVDRISALNGGLSQDASTQARLQLIKSSIGVILRSPEGIGWGDLWSALPVWAVLDSGYRQYPHNIVLEVFAEAGWLAGIALVVLIAVAVGRARAGMTTAAGSAVFALLLFSLLNAMVSGDVNDNRFLFAMIAISLATSRSRGREARDGDRATVVASLIQPQGDPAHRR